MKGDINLFGWMVTVNLPDRLSGTGTDGFHDALQHDFDVNLTHESIHFIQALSTGYVFGKACSLWDEVLRVVHEVKQIPVGQPIPLPLRVDSDILTILEEMRIKSNELTTPDIEG